MYQNDTWQSLISRIISDPTLSLIQRLALIQHFLWSDINSDPKLSLTQESTVAMYYKDTWQSVVFPHYLWSTIIFGTSLSLIRHYLWSNIIFDPTLLLIQHYLQPRKARCMRGWWGLCMVRIPDNHWFLVLSLIQHYLWSNIVSDPMWSLIQHYLYSKGILHFLSKQLLPTLWLLVLQSREARCTTT